MRTDGAFDIGYRARFVQDGVPQGEVMTLKRVGNVVAEPPAVAYNAREQEWLVVWGEGAVADRNLRGSILRADGSLRRADFQVATNAEGASSPRVAWNSGTNSYLVTYHAWISTDARFQELTPDGESVGNSVSIANAQPSNGTYFHPVAASNRDSRFLVLIMENWLRVAGTFLSSPQRLP